MPVYELAALGAATCWAITGIIAAVPAGHLGAIVFNQFRQVFVSLLLLAYVLISGIWRELDVNTLIPLLLSGFIGIFIGDSLLFTALNRLGPRRSGILFALNAPMAAILGFFFLGEELSLKSIAGITIIIIGVLLAIIFGKRRAQMHEWEKIKGTFWVGVAFGLTAALGQAIGSIIVRPVMEAGIDPFLASLIRVGIAACCLTVLTQLPYPVFKTKSPLTLKIALLAALTGFISLALGMTLLLFAFSGGKVGIVSTISATTPVVILPLLWLRTGERPAGGAWFGALLVVAGMALIMWH